DRLRRLEAENEQNGREEEGRREEEAALQLRREQVAAARRAAELRAARMFEGREQQQRPPPEDIIELDPIPIARPIALRELPEPRREEVDNRVIIVLENDEEDGRDEMVVRAQLRDALRERMERMNEARLAMLQGVHDQERERDGQRREAVTEEMIKAASALREMDQSDPSTVRFSRGCVVCASENPRQRAVFIRCGHIVCYPCAVDNARSPFTEGKCVFCRSDGGFVKIFEDECER
ncbi:hypothetical protein PMAYCL1PPCAC_11544, partial [Pristionchus mayeri]